ncbi:MAG: potassium/proton antiporter [Acidimicrobiales bacterium]
MSDPAPALAVAAGLVLLAVLASKVSARLGVPALLLFLVLGMLAGSDGPGGIDFTDYELAQSLGVVALAFILWSGGLDTNWDDIRPVFGQGVALATVGVAVTALIAGAVAAWVFGFSLTTGLLIGAIVSSTDAAAVFSVLRSRGVSLRGRLRPLLELESGSNDPMAVFLTIGLIRLLDDPSTSPVELLGLLGQQMAVGGVVGYGLARLAIVALNRLQLEYDGLYPVVTVALVVFIFGTTTLLGGSGFLAVYVAGLVMGRVRFVHKASLTRVHDAIAWLAQISMFLLLGLLVFPSDLVEVGPRALLVSVVLILVARPAGVFLSLPTRRLRLADKALISWVGLRGALPIILATFPLVEGIAAAEDIFNIVFFVVLTSVLVQGTTVAGAARRLGVAAPQADTPSPALEFVHGGSDVDLHQLRVVDGAPAAGQRLVQINLPPGALVVLVSRSGEHIVPQGQTTLRPDDLVLLLAPDDALDETRQLLEKPAQA